MNYPDTIIKILQAAHSSTLSAEDKAILDKWLAADPDNQRLYALLRDEEGMARDVARLDNFPLEAAWERQAAAIDFGKEKSLSLRGWRIAATVAAAAALLLGAFLWLQEPVQLSDIPLAAISPGTNQARITLADGRVLELSEAQQGLVLDSGLRYEDGSTIPLEGGGLSTAKFEMQVPKGGQYRLTLPDGSKLWINSDSKINYLEDAQERRVLLTGEAYFEVRRKEIQDPTGNTKLKPFRVEVDGQEVQVLGTHFNVKAYADEGASYATLVEGSVKVKAADKFLMLDPGQQSRSGNGFFGKRNVDVQTVLAWKEGNFMFQAERLAEIITQLERWYDVSFVVEDKALLDECFEAKVPRFSELKDLLHLLEKTKKIAFKYKGKTIHVIKQ